MKTTITLVALLALIGLGTFWAIQKNKEEVIERQTPDFDKQFAVKNVDEIQRIFIADRDGNEALLDRKKGYWEYTNRKTGKTFRARQTVIRDLLETIQKISIKEPVANPALKNRIAKLATNAKKVEIYTNIDADPIRTYYVGSSASGGTGTFMMIEDSERPWVVYLPGWQGTLDTRYIVKEKNWRDVRLVHDVAANIEFVKVEYFAPNQKPFSFEIKANGKDNYQVNAVSSETQALDNANLNPDNVATYLEDFAKVGTEMVVFDTYLRDSIVSGTPFAVISYKKKGKADFDFIKIYPVINPDANRGDGEIGTRQKAQRYYVYAGEDYFFLAQHRTLRDLFWSYPFFFRAEKVDLEEDEAFFKR